MNEMMVFENEMFGEIRIMDTNGEVWFVALDIAKALGYNNPAEAVRDHCRKVNKISHHSKPLPPVNMLIIPESDLYRLIMRSQLPSAERFQDWVTDEVLPTIRKTGSYSMNQPVKKSIVVTETASLFKAYFEIAQVIGCDKNVSAISANQAATKSTGINMLEDMGLTHLVAEKQEIFFTPTELSSRVYMSAAQFNKALERIDFQKRINDRWIPTEEGKNYSKIYDTGKKCKSGVSIEQVKWSEKVLKFI